MNAGPMPYTGTVRLRRYCSMELLKEEPDMQKISARALLAGLKEIPEGEDTQVTTVVADSRRLLPG